MADKQDKDQGREATQRDRTARLGDVTDQASENTNRTMQSGGEAMRHGMHIAGEAGRRGLEAAGETTQRSMMSAAEGARRVSEASADQFGDMAEHFAETVRRSTEDFGTLLRLPGFGGGIEQMQRAITGLVTRVIEANVKATQEVVRAANPGIVVELQHRFARHYIDGLIEGSAEVFRVSRHLAEDALRPIEERARRRQEDGSSRHRGQGRSSHGRFEHEGQTVAEVMSRDVELARPDQSVQDVARKMAEMDTGVLPVGENDRLVGMVTDRDIALRVAAEGKDPRQTRVRDIMSEGVRYCFEDEDVEDVAENMAEQKVHRLPVVSRNKRLVGVVSLGDIATTQPHQLAGSAPGDVSGEAGREPRRAFAGQRPGRLRQDED